MTEEKCKTCISRGLYSAGKCNKCSRTYKDEYEFCEPEMFLRNCGKCVHLGERDSWGYDDLLIYDHCMLKKVDISGGIPTARFCDDYKMKITKTYCDICKKEMKESGYSFKIELQRQGYRAEENIEIDEICSVCIKLIREGVDTIIEGAKYGLT